MTALHGMGDMPFTPLRPVPPELRGSQGDKKHFALCGALGGSAARDGRTGRNDKISNIFDAAAQLPVLADYNAVT